MKNNKAMVEYQRALIYCRVSSDRQVKEGHGLDSQELRCIQYAGDKKLQVAEIFREEGISGKLFDRPAMQRLIEYLDNFPNEKFVIIFDDLQRFSRDVPVHLQLKAELVIQRKARLECLNFSFEDSPAGRYIELIVVGAGQLQREENTIQVKNKMKARLEAGYWPFCPPPGLKNVEHPIKGRILMPHEPLASIYKQAIEKYDRNYLNTFEEVRQFILAQYNKCGIMRPLSLNGVQRILTQPLYCEFLEYKPWGVDWRPGRHEGFISSDTYKRVQAKLAKSAKPRLRSDYNEDFPVRNYLLCPDCHKPTAGSWHKVKYPHYWCKTKGCPRANKSLRREDVHRDFEDLLRTIVPKPGAMKAADVVFQDMWDNRQQIEEQGHKLMRTEIGKIQAEVDAYKPRIAKAKSDLVADEYEKEMAKLLEQKAALEEKLDAKQKYLPAEFGTAKKVVFKVIENPLDIWKSGVYERQRLLLNMYFRRGIAYDKKTGFGTIDLPLIVKVLSDESMSKNNLVEMAGVKPASKTNSLFNWSQD